jgi:glutathione S-transferase
MDLEIIWASGSPYSWSVLLTLEVKKLQYKSTLIELFKGENRTPEFLKMNPRGKVPVLRDGDYFIYESLAVMSYLDRKFSETALFGDSPHKSAEIMKLMSEYSSYIAPHIGHIISSAFWSNSPNLTRLEDAKQNLFYELANLEKILIATNCLAGKEISAVDIFIFPFIQLLMRSEAKLNKHLSNYQPIFDSKKYSAISNWLKRFEDLPGYNNTYPPHWRQDKEIDHYIS